MDQFILGSTTEEHLSFDMNPPTPEVDLQHYALVPELTVTFNGEQFCVPRDNRFELIDTANGKRPNFQTYKISPEYIRNRLEFENMLRDYNPECNTFDLYMNPAVWEDSFIKLLSRDARVCHEFYSMDLPMLYTRINLNYWKPSLRNDLYPLVYNDWRIAICHSYNEALSESLIYTTGSSDANRNSPQFQEIRKATAQRLKNQTQTAFNLFRRLRAEEDRIAPKMKIYDSEGVSVRLFAFPYFTQDSALYFEIRLLPDYHGRELRDAMSIECAAIMRLPDNLKNRSMAEIDFLNIYYSPHYH